MSVINECYILFIGIAAIIFSLQSTKAARVRDMKTARDKGRTVLKLVSAGLICTIAVVIVSVVVWMSKNSHPVHQLQTSEQISQYVLCIFVIICKIFNIIRASVWVIIINSSSSRKSSSSSSNNSNSSSSIVVVVVIIVVVIIVVIVVVVVVIEVGVVVVVVVVIVVVVIVVVVVVVVVVLVLVVVNAVIIIIIIIVLGLLILLVTSLHTCI